MEFSVRKKIHVWFCFLFPEILSLLKPVYALNVWSFYSGKKKSQIFFFPCEVLSLVKPVHAFQVTMVTNICMYFNEAN